jgi:hypothetical protein
LWLGIAFTLIGLAIYAAEVYAGKLQTPWYVPALATLGMATIVLSLVRRGTVWRLIGLVLVGLLAGFEWWFVAGYSKLPPYTGPVAAGRPFPAFTVRRADGTPFTEKDLHGDRDTVLVFFRGWW